MILLTIIVIFGFLTTIKYLKNIIYIYNLIDFKLDKISKDIEFIKTLINLDKNKKI